MYQKVTIGQAARALARGEIIWSSIGFAMQLPGVRGMSIRKARKRVMRFRRYMGDLLLQQ